jgi:hypothetical protein
MREHLGGRSATTTRDTHAQCETSAGRLFEAAARTAGHAGAHGDAHAC